MSDTLQNDPTSELASVIMPAFNRAHLIEEALQSVFDQTYRPLELIVVDDGSTDETTEVTKRWRDTLAGSDFWVRIIQKANGGNASAKNVGIQESRGEYIQILDTDDILLPQKLAQEIASLKRNHADYAYSRVAIKHEDGICITTPHPNRFKDALVTRFTMYQISVVFRRRIFESIGGFDTTLPRGSDRVFLTALKAKGFPGIFVDNVHAEVRLHSGERMSQAKDSILAGTRRDASEYLRLAWSRELINMQILKILQETGHDTPDERWFLARSILYCADTYAAGGDVSGARRCIDQAYSVACGRAKVVFNLIRFLENLVGARVTLSVTRNLAGLVKAGKRRFAG